ncbi:MAG: hypothetical protein LT102_02120 [Burkholderiaceae bacterium]|nr:hypothetical protein [Burkholderiaceae bacterium]
MKTRFATALFLSTLALSPVASAQSSAESAQASLEQAMRYYENGQYRLALPHLEAAAEAGDAHAQEMLGFMHAMGGIFYPGVALDRREALRWFDRAAQSGQPVSRYMRCALQRTPDYALPPMPRARKDCFDHFADSGISPAQ